MYDFINQYYKRYDEDDMALAVADGYLASINHNRPVLERMSLFLRAGVSSLGAEVIMLAILDLVRCL